MLIHNADITGSLTINGVPYTTGSYTGIFIAGTNIMSANTVSLTGSFTGSFFGDGSQLSGVTSYTDADTLSFIQGYSGSYSGSFSGSFFGDGSNLSGVTSYTDADTLDFINSLDVVSGSIQTVSTVSDTFTSVTSYTVTHNFGTKEVIVSVYENDTLIFPSSINTPTTNTVTITFPEPVTGRVVVVKAGHIVSGSINYNSVLNKPTLVSGSSQISFTGITNKPTLVSGSSQITYSGLTGIPSGIVSGSSQVSFNGIVNKPTLVSGSSQVTYSGLTGIPSGIVSGSSQVSYSGITNRPSGIVSGSTQVAQFGYAITGSNQFNGSQAITGSLTVTGAIVAQTLNVQQVTSSVVFSSGSNVFGNSLGNTQQFTGSVGVTGSLAVAGAATFNLGSGEMRLNRAGTAEYLKLNTYYLLTDGNDQLLGSVTGATNIYAGSGASPKVTISSTGAATFQTTGNNGIINIGGSTYYSQLETNSTLGGLKIKSVWGAANSGIIQFINGTSENIRMHIADNGNVDVGLTNATDRLTISRNVADNAGGITLYNAETSGYGSALTFRVNYAGVYNVSRIHGDWGTGNSGLLHFFTANTSQTLVERMLIDGSGNVGIGVNQPSTRLNVIKEDNGGGGIGRFEANNRTQYIEIGYQNINQYASVAGNAQLTFSTNSNERMRIASAGNVIIGNTTAYGGLTISDFTSNDGNDSLAFFYRGTSGGHESLIKFYDFRGQVNAAIGNNLEDDGSGTQKARLVFKTSFSGAPTERMRIDSSGRIITTVNGINGQLQVFQSDANYNSDAMMYLHNNRNATSGYNFAKFFSGYPNNTNDIEFAFRGDGTGYSDGGWTSPASDYAEYFESVDGTALQVGLTVVLENGKIRQATESDTNIIGAIRPKNASLFLGNNEDHKWNQKYLKDDFGAYILDSDGMRTLNPEHNPDLEYIPREKRDEWNIVGLVGQIPILKSQPVGSNWVKMYNVSSTVEMWLIK